MGPLEAFWGEAQGLRYLQLDPASKTPDRTLIVALHGRGADPTDLSPLAYEIGPKEWPGEPERTASRTRPSAHNILLSRPARARWLLPQGPRPVSLGLGMVGWAWYELEDQRSTLLQSRDQLAVFLHHMADELNVPTERTALVGFSQGAVMALHVGLASPEPYAALVSMSGYLPAEDALPPDLAARQQPILIVHGSEDHVIPVERARQARDTLLGLGLAPQYVEFPMGHQITPASLAAVGQYLDRVLPPAPVE